MSSTKIFVGKLPDNAKEDELQLLFESYGTVTECSVMPSGYAFVHMKESEEAQKAIEELNNVSFQGQNISVEMSHSVRGKPRGGGPMRGGRGGYRGGPYHPYGSRGGPPRYPPAPYGPRGGYPPPRRPPPPGREFYEGGYYPPPPDPYYDYYRAPPPSRYPPPDPYYGDYYSAGYPPPRGGAAPRGPPPGREYDSYASSRGRGGYENGR